VRFHIFFFSFILIFKILFADLMNQYFLAIKMVEIEFFYKESAHQVAGIPPPSDPMGNVTMCAKTRLERDHFYNLL